MTDIGVPRLFGENHETHFPRGSGKNGRKTGAIVVVELNSKQKYVVSEDVKCAVVGDISSNVVGRDKIGPNVMTPKI